MDRLIGRCLAMSVGAVALALVLLAAGVPGTTILAFAPLVVCLGAQLVMGHGAGHRQLGRDHDQGTHPERGPR